MALDRMYLFINGAKRAVTYDVENDTLAMVLRRLGLTGVKIGCGKGECGACSVILNGEVVRSCVKKMKRVEEYSEITTIEGIGTPEHQHPLQLAWNTYGAVQCGFCSPGFIVSAKCLLDHNPNPSREDVREWFAKHHNICRCTGYRPLVDAVMAAAKYMRGECSIDEIQWKMPADGEVYTTRFPRRESGISRVTGLANYGDDVSRQMPDDTLELAPVIPQTMHAHIRSLDYSEALKMPGVVRVITAKDVKGTNRISIGINHPRAKATGLERPIFVEDTVYKYGDVIALVAADTREHARAAARAVKVEFDELPHYHDELEAMKSDAMQIHPGVPNVMLRTPLHKGGDTKAIMESAPHVVSGSFYTSREPHLTIEPDCVQAFMDAKGVLTIQYKVQFVHGSIWFIADGLGLPIDKIRLAPNEVGGSFGYSVSPITMALAGAAAMALERPVNMTLTYAEHMHMTGKRAPSHNNIRMACDENGKIQAMEWHISYEQGAYTEYVQDLIVKGLFFPGMGYYIPNATAISQGCYSNIAHETTYRAFSATQSMTAVESVMDIMARKLGMDPFDFRYLNLARPGDTNINNVPYNEYPFEGMMEMLRPKYEAARKRVAKKSTDTVKCGVGIAFGSYATGSCKDSADIDLELMPDGSFVNYNTWEDVGQHAEAGALMLTYKALRPMNVPLEKIKLVSNDSKFCPNTGLAGGSRMHYYFGNATLDAAKKLMDAMRKPDGTYRTYDEMVAEGIPTKYRGTHAVPLGATTELSANNGQGSRHHECIYNIFMAEVSVDTKTGKTKVDRMTCVSDIGVIGNILGVEGQAYGGIEHSIGFALQEDYSDFKKHSTMTGAGTLRIDQMPDDIELLWYPDYRKRGPHGSAGASENFQSTGHVAILNAIDDACGVRVYEIPARPEKILAGLRGESLKPEPYYLGGDFYELYEKMVTEERVPDDVDREYMAAD